MELPPSNDPTPPPLFKMRRIKKDDYWSFIRLIAPNAQLPPGKKAWESSDTNLAYCLKCKSSFSFKSGSSASIRKHMNEKHPQDLSRAGREQASRRVAIALHATRKSDAMMFSPRKRTRKIDPADEEMATRAFIDWIAKRLRPLSVADDKELRVFLTLIQTMRGLYELPSRRTITEKMQNHCQFKRSLVKTQIAEDADFYSLTSDMWTSRATDSYISLTIHFVNSNFEMMTYTLDVMSFRGKHTGTQD